MSNFTPQIYVGTYAKYEKKYLTQGLWLTLTDYKGMDDFLEAARAVHHDEVDPEIMFQDYMDIPEQYRDDLPGIFDFIEVVSASGLDYEVYLAGVDLGIPLELIEEAYQGEYDSLEHLAYKMAMEEGISDTWPCDCIDWELAAKMVALDYQDLDGYYFSRT